MSGNDVETVTQPPGTWRAAVRGNVLAMGLVSMLTDFSSEMLNPLLPIFIAGLIGVVVIGAVTTVGTKVSNQFANIGNALQ